MGRFLINVVQPWNRPNMDANNLAPSSHQESTSAQTAQKNQSDAKQRYEAIIQGLHPFQSLDIEFIRKMANHCKIVDCPTGRFVFNREKESQWVYYLLEGEINLIDSQFKSNTISSLSEQAKFPLNSANPSNYSARVKRDSRLLCIERSGVETVMVWSEADVSGAMSNDSVVDSVILPSSKEATNDEETFKNYFLDTSYSSDNKPSETEKKVETEVTSDWMGALLESPLFTTIPAGNIQKLFALFEPETVAEGQEVIREGEEGEYFYVIAEGKAQVELSNKTIVPLKTGQYFGEEALVGNTIRNATVRMTTDGLLMRLAKKYFVSLLQEPLLRSVELDDVPNLSAKVQMVDVRLPVEYRFAHVADSINIPLNRLRQTIKKLDLNTVYVVTDDGGARSKVAVQLFLQAGFSSAVLNQAHIYY